LTTFDTCAYPKEERLNGDDWRLTVKLRSHRALRDYMEFHHIKTGYALAKKADILPGTAGHLTSGRRNTCSLRTAKAIEEALGCPPGFLFVTEMSEVVGDNRRGGRAA
jgi:hypothetical protein